MLTTERIQRLHKLIWALIFGGLFGVIIGIVIRDPAPVTAHVLLVAGVIAMVAGCALIYVRSRIDEESSGP